VVATKRSYPTGSPNSKLIITTVKELGIVQLFFLMAEKIVYLVLPIVLMYAHAKAQIIHQEGETMEVSSGAFTLTQIPLSKADDVGDAFLNRNWMNGDIRVKGGTTWSSLQIKYHVGEQALYLRAKTYVQVLDSKNIESFRFFRLKDTVCFEKITWKTNDQNAEDFFEVSYSGQKFSIYKRYSLTISRANYNPALNVGSRSDKYLLKDKIYLRIEETGAIEPVTSKRMLQRLLPEKATQKFKQLSKENNLNWKETLTHNTLIKEVEKVFTLRNNE
jgi:hypothetical protein